MTDTTTNPVSDTSAGNNPPKKKVSHFLSFFGGKTTSQPDAQPISSPKKAIKKGAWNDLTRLLNDDNRSPKEKKEARKQILKSKVAIAQMKQDRAFAVAVLSRASADELKDELFASFGARKDAIVGDTLLELTDRFKKGFAYIDNESVTIDPDLSARLSKQISKEVFNDPQKGIGPRFCNTLYANGSYDLLCDLVDKGVDTTIPAVSRPGDGASYSGFVMPLQHPLMRDLADLGKLEKKEKSDPSTLSEADKKKLAGRQKLFAKLAKTENAISLTKWDEVENCDLTKAFKAKPGTIWGFEKVREPFVEAARETDSGVRPIRMMDIWKAVQPMINDNKKYEELISDPDSFIDGYLNGVALTGVNFDTQKKKDDYLAETKKKARRFLKELSEQLPRGSMARASADDPGKSVSSIAGVDEVKFMSSFACKAGLWAAKVEKDPVYYILDGLKMEDVVDYKKLKYKAIGEYLDPASAAGAATFQEVITLKEVREILRNWNDLKFDDGTPVVQFVNKGKLMTPADTQKFVDKYQKLMDTANTTAKRRPAPDRKKFSKELAAIDPNLPQQLDDEAAGGTNTKTVDMDARDIVRKAGYLLRLSNSKPDYVLKYLMAKCLVLQQYKLIPGDLIDAARELTAAIGKPAPVKSEVDTAVGKVEDALAKTAKQFQKPLATSLVRHQQMKLSDRMNKMAEAN